MKNVRIWFTKEKECKYISHLDLNRCMLRAVRRAELPIWYTEGFNPHPFVTFPLPISLGIDGKRECMDIRIVEDGYDIKLIPTAMNKYLPEGIQVFEATYPVLDPKYICFASYRANISVDGMKGTELETKVKELTLRDSVIIQKKSKAGMKDLDVLPYIKEIVFASSDDDNCEFTVTLPAGNTKNIGLPLILKAIENALVCEINYRIIKENMFDENMKVFA
mgnify:CR=1 FL=1